MPLPGEITGAAGRARGAGGGGAGGTGEGSEVPGATWPGAEVRVGEVKICPGRRRAVGGGQAESGLRNAPEVGEGGPEGVTRAWGRSQAQRCHSRCRPLRRDTAGPRTSPGGRLRGRLGWAGGLSRAPHGRDGSGAALAASPQSGISLPWADQAELPSGLGGQGHPLSPRPQDSRGWHGQDCLRGRVAAILVCPTPGWVPPKD